MAESAELVPNPRLPAHRQKAYRLRKAVDAGQEVSPEDAAFMAAYEQAASGTAVGASRNRRRVEVEEESVAVGTGDAALIAASAAQAREEGKRLDSLTSTVITMATTAANMYRDMAKSALEIMKQIADRNEKLEAAHVKLFDTVREHHLARVEAEVAAIEAENANEEKPDVTEDITRGLIEAVSSHLTHAGGAPGKKS